MKEGGRFFGAIEDLEIAGFLRGTGKDVSLRPSVILDRGKFPGVGFLKQLLSLPNEVGVYKAKYGEWCGFPGSLRNLVVNAVPLDTRCFIHSHVAGSNTPELPSCRDLMSYFNLAENCIVSLLGFTAYQVSAFFKEPFGRYSLTGNTKEDQDWRKKIVNARYGILLKELEEIEDEFVGLKDELEDKEELGREAYTEFLRRVKVSVRVISWEELDDSVLFEIFSGKQDNNLTK